MKLLVLSDIHGNFDALQSVYNKEKYDKMIFLGDAVDYGPEPDRVLDFLKANSDINILGNHDNAVLTGSSCNCSFDMLELSDYTRDNISMKLLDKSDMDFLKTFKLNTDTEIIITEINVKVAFQTISHTVIISFLSSNFMLILSLV